MREIKKLAVVITAVITVGAVSFAAFAADSAAVEENKTYTLSEMLAYAIEDEYLAYAK